MDSMINSTTNRTDTAKLHTKNYDSATDHRSPFHILLHLLDDVANYYVSFIADSAD